MCGEKRSVYEGRLSLLPFVPPVDAFPPLAALSVEGFPPVVVLPVAVVIRLREVVVLFVEDEAR